MRTLRDFLSIHSGDTAWIFGKGPTLDRFPMETAGRLSCPLNDVVQYVPSPAYCFANDGTKRWADCYHSTDVLFQPRRTVVDHQIGNPDSWPCELIAYPEASGPEIMRESRETMAAVGPCIRRGTVGSAIQILHIMGVAKIVCVGIDGGGGRAARSWRTPMRADHYEDYNAIRDGLISAALILGIELEFFGLESPIQSPNGMTTLRILRPILIEGESHETGDIIDVLPRLARLLMQQRNAEPFLRSPPFGGYENTSVNRVLETSNR
jgi:hypothetical protein